MTSTSSTGADRPNERSHEASCDYFNKGASAACTCSPRKSGYGRENATTEVVRQVQHPWGPVEDAFSEVLILGSMPSDASLADGFYFGHKQNAFWKIMGELVGAHRELPPTERARALRKHNVALWDVLRECVRDSSSDSSIAKEKVQDFESFFASHPMVRSVVFNGVKAKEVFEAHVVLPAGVRTWLLPSTSARRAMKGGYAAKLAAWRVGLAEAREYARSGNGVLGRVEERAER